MFLYRKYGNTRVYDSTLVRTWVTGSGRLSKAIYVTVVAPGAGQAVSQISGPCLVVVSTCWAEVLGGAGGTGRAVASQWAGSAQKLARTWSKRRGVTVQN